MYISLPILILTLLGALLAYATLRVRDDRNAENRRRKLDAQEAERSERREARQINDVDLEKEAVRESWSNWVVQQRESDIVAAQIEIHKDTIRKIVNDVVVANLEVHEQNIRRIVWDELNLVLNNQRSEKN